MDCILITFGVIDLLVVGWLYIRWRERKEVARFASMAGMSGQDYVSALGLRHGTPEAEAALKLRSIIAGLGRIPPESVLPEHKFREYKGLGEFGSPDTIELIVTLEERFGVSIPDEVAEGIIGDVFRLERDVTVKEMTHRFLAILRDLQKKGGRSEK
jgi:acyl carrier protein